ncbi:methyltransferase domain-containing protein [Candidatus Woesearchaeota archaeon]|nr:methyltransferase domain-containing protein [Candidatus Woesearchaeota archaeon]
MLDQHFMIDEELLQRIVTAASLKKEDSILEIGPGTGNLTKLLIGKGKILTVIEKDKELLQKLKEELKQEKNITFIQADATQQKLPEFTKCVSNLPYTICEPLLWIFTRYEFETLVLVVPDKFTDLLQGYVPSRLHLLMETFYNIEYLERIPKQAFDPQPKVESALIKIARKNTPAKFLKSFLSQYDKKTKNALKEILMKMGKTKSEALQEISFSLRPALQEKNIINLTLKEIEEIQIKFE